jgi:hypothetical protein
MATLTLRPNGDNSVGLTPYPSSPATNYDKVDDSSPDDGATYVRSPGVGYTTDKYTLPDHTSEIGTISSVVIYARFMCSYNDASGAAKTLIRTHSVDYLGGVNYSDHSTWVNISTTYNTNPNTGVAWTWSEVDDLICGISLSGANGPDTACTQVYVVVTYTPPPDPPTNVAATNGTHPDKVVVTWTQSAGATGYKVYRDGADVSGLLGDVATYDDVGAGAPTITPGTATATAGAHDNKVSLSIAGESTANGATHTYTVTAYSVAGGESSPSASDTGYRSPGALAYQWQVSAADSDADYSNIAGATTENYDYMAFITYSSLSASQGTYSKFVRCFVLAVIPQATEKYYRCLLSATGCANAYSVADSGYISNPLLGYQWQRSAADSDAGYSNISGANTPALDDVGAPVYPSGRYYRCVFSSANAATVTTTGIRGYRSSLYTQRKVAVVVVKNSAGETLQYVNKLIAPKTDYGVNSLGIMEFTVPVEVARLANFVYPNEAWLYVDGTLQKQFKIIDTARRR